MRKDSGSSDVDSDRAKPPLRPDLNQSSSVSNDDERILNSLKPSQFQSRNSSSSRKTYLVNLMLLMLAAAAAIFFGYRYWTNQTDSRGSAVEVAQVDSATAGPKSGSRGAEKQVAPLQSASSAIQAAQIVNEVSAQSDVTSLTSTKAKITNALEEGVKPPLAALQKALEGKPKQDARTELATGSKSATQSTRTPVATAQKGATPPADKDISLIAALLAHNASSQSVIKPSGSRENTVGLTNVPLKNASTGPATESSIAVTRTDPIKSALQQCEGLDFFQREVCKIKVCDKFWETNSACKATLSSAK